MDSEGTLVVVFCQTRWSCAEQASCLIGEAISFNAKVIFAPF